MEINKDTIITLENHEKYIIENITFYGGIKYALAKKESNAKEQVIIEEIIDKDELFIKMINDEELIDILMKILEP